jgi:hypothetical protein
MSSVERCALRNNTACDGLLYSRRPMDLDVEALKARLEALRIEHRDLDEVIARLVDSSTCDQLQLQRLKKRKLVLKDLILKIESQLLPDIIA